MTSDDPGCAHPHPGRFQISLATIFALVAWPAVTYGLLTWIAPITGFGSIAPILLLYIASSVALATICCRILRNTALRAICGIGAFVFVLIFLDAGVVVISRQMYAHPPPRPMFHNIFAEHERMLLPYWHRASFMTDKLGNVAWADHNDNVVVVLIGAKDGSRAQPSAGLAETTFYVGGGDLDEKSVTITRTSNELIIIALDGSIVRCRLGPKAARDYYERLHSKSVTDLTSVLSTILTPESREKIDNFLLEI